MEEKRKDTVLVTGACINTGAAIVRRFAGEGYQVIFTGRDRGRVEEAEQRYREEFPDIPIEGYVLRPLTEGALVDEEEVERLFAALDREGIFVGTLVLNAADLGLGMKIFENPLTDMMRVLNTNILWNYCIAEHAAKRMKEYGGGSIIFVNSNTAYRAIPDRIAYSASKAGQLGMMRAMAFDLGKYHIRVNAVLPGMIKTDRWEKDPEFYRNVPSRFTPLGDVAIGEDVADAVWYFAALARNTTGAELTVDGGNMVQMYPVIH